MDNQPILVQIPGKESGDIWMLTGYWNGKENITGDWIYKFDLDGDSWKMVMPFGFDALDGASVPRIVRPVINFGGRDCPDHAWMPHDFAYYHDGIMPAGSFFKSVNDKWAPVGIIERDFVDLMFYEELKKPKHSLSWHKPWLAYKGVRAGGWVAWGN